MAVGLILVLWVYSKDERIYVFKSNSNPKIIFQNAIQIQKNKSCLNKYNKQSQRIWETLINTVTCSPKTKTKVAKKLKRISLIPRQIY